MGRQGRKAARESLLMAAVRLFSERGYDGVGTRELAEVAGVNLGAIQYHFGSKARLFVEAMDHLWDQTDYQTPFHILSETPANQESAAAQLGKFVSALLAYLVDPKTDQPCRMMFREIFTGTSRDPEMLEALTTSVVKDFSQPYQQAMIGLLRVLVPHASDEKRKWYSRNIMAQCVFPATNRPFIERMEGTKLEAEKYFRTMVNEILSFSMSAMGFGQGMIMRAVEAGLAYMKRRPPERVRTE